MTNLLEELIQADANGERIITSLHAGDQFYYRGNYHTIVRMQWASENQVFVTTTDPADSAYELVNLQGEKILHQPLVTFRFGRDLLFPALLSDEHAAAERQETDASLW